jgi:hypothetical protein
MLFYLQFDLILILPANNEKYTIHFIITQFLYVSPDFDIVGKLLPRPQQQSME